MLVDRLTIPRCVWSLKRRTPQNCEYVRPNDRRFTALRSSLDGQILETTGELTSIWVVLNERLAKRLMAGKSLSNKYSVLRCLTLKHKSLLPNYASPLERYQQSCLRRHK